MILYKYYGFSSGLSALSSQQLGFRHPESFNDPLELTYFDLNNNCNTIDFLKKTLGVLSLTRAPLNPLMWAHYGDEHKGFVIGYDVDDEFFSSKKYNLIPVGNGSVIYTPEKERIEIPTNIRSKIYQLSSGGYDPSELADNAAVDFLEKILLCKHSCWRYEQEVRVVKLLDSLFEESSIWKSDPNRSCATIRKKVANGISTPVVNGLFLFDKKAKIKEVYLGLRNPLLDKTHASKTKDKSLYNAAKEQDWLINKMIVKNGTWDFDFEEISSDYLLVPERAGGLINSFSFDGIEGDYLLRNLPKLLNSNDRYEFNNWFGNFSLKKNGGFIKG